MDCEEIKHRLSLYIDEQLDEAERLKIEEHLKDCPDCTAYYKQLLKLQEMADDFEPGGDEEFWLKQKDTIIDKIEKAESKGVTPLPVKKSRAKIYRILAVAATIALVAIISVFELKYNEPEKIPFRGKSQPATSVPRVAGKQEPVDTGRTRYSKAEQADEMALREEYELSGQVEDKKAAKSIGIPKPIATKTELKPESDVDVVQPNEAIVPAYELAPEITPPAEAPTISVKSKSPEVPVRGSEEKAAPSPVPSPDKTADEAAQTQQPEAVTDLGKSKKVTAEAAPVDKYTLLSQAKQHGEKAASMAEKDSEETSKAQYEDYLLWRAKVDSLEIKYGYILSIHSEEIKTKGRLDAARGFTSSEAPSSPPYSAIAIAYYNLARLTPSEDERKAAVLKLNRLAEIADSSTVNKIETLLDSLDSKSK